MDLPIAVLNTTEIVGDLDKVFIAAVIIVAIVAVGAIIKGHIKTAVVIFFGLVLVLGIWGVSKSPDGVAKSISDSMKTLVGAGD